MDAVPILGSPKIQNSHHEDWDTSHVAEMVFEACLRSDGTVRSADIVTYVKENWVQKDSDIKQADDQLRRLLISLDPGGHNEALQFPEFQEKFAVWVDSEQNRDSNSRSPKMETYETECDESNTIESSTTESLLSWDYPPINGYENISLRKENQGLKEQISSSEIYNTDLVDEIRELQMRLKCVSENKSDLDTEVDEQNSEITTLKSEVIELREYAQLYKQNLHKLESQVKRPAIPINYSETPDCTHSPCEKDGFVTRDEHNAQISKLKKKLSELQEHILFLKKENEALESQMNQLTNHHNGVHGEGISLAEEIVEVQEHQDHHVDLFLSEEQVLQVLEDGEEGHPDVLLDSFLNLQHDNFAGLVTSAAKQMNRVLRGIPRDISSNLLPKAERQLYTDTLHQMTSSKHLSEIKIAQLVDLFRRLKVEHRRLGTEHACLKSDYQDLITEHDHMKDEIVTTTRTNAQLRNEMLAVYDSAQLTPPATPENSMHRRDDSLIRSEVDDLKKRLKAAEKSNLTLTLAIEEQTKQRNALQVNIDELQNELNSSITTINRIEFENKTLTRDNEKLAETYTRQRGDLDELRKEWVAEMDRCTSVESGYNSLNLTITQAIRGLVKLLKPAMSFPSFDPKLCLPLEDWAEFLNKEFLEATKVVEEVRLNTSPSSNPNTTKVSVLSQTDLSEMKPPGELSRAACFEESRSLSDSPATALSNGSVSRGGGGKKGSEKSMAAGLVEERLADNEDISNEYQFTTDVASLSKRSVEGEFQAIVLSFENDTFTLQKRLTMHDRAFQNANNNFKTELEKIKELLLALKSDFLPEDKQKQVEQVRTTLSLLPETLETLTTSSLAAGKCSQEEKHVRHFEVMVAHSFHVKKSLNAALALCNQNADLGMPKKDVDRAAVRKKTLAVAAAMRKDEEKQKEMQASEHSSVFSSFAGVVKNLMVKTPAEPDLANRRATEMMQRMKTVETLGADKEALYKEGYRGGLSSGLHDTFDNIKKEQRTCDETVDNLNKRASKLEREVAFYKKHSNHLFYGGAATPAATLRTIFCTIFINLLVLFLLLLTVPLPEHSGYTLGTGYISLQEFITSQFLNVPDRNRPLL